MKKVAFFEVILAGILWGTSGIFVHFLSPFGFTSLQMTASRALISFSCMLVFVLFRNKRLFLIGKPTDLLLLAGIGICLFLVASCYYQSMQLTSVSTAVVLMYTAPIYVTVFSMFFLHEHFTKWKFFSIVCMLIGCLFVSGIIGSSTWNTAGILFGIFSGITYATYIILTKIAVRRELHPTTVTLYGFLFMSLISLLVLKPAKFADCISKAPAITIPLLLALGIVTFVAPYILYTLAIKVLPAGTCSALSIVDPMSATIFSILFFHEPLTPFSILGIVLILFVVFQIGIREEKEKN